MTGGTPAALHAVPVSLTSRHGLAPDAGQASSRLPSLRCFGGMRALTRCLAGLRFDRLSLSSPPTAPSAAASPGQGSTQAHPASPCPRGRHAASGASTAQTTRATVHRGDRRQYQKRSAYCSGPHVLNAALQRDDGCKTGVYRGRTDGRAQLHGIAGRFCAAIALCEAVGDVVLIWQAWYTNLRQKTTTKRFVQGEAGERVANITNVLQECTKHSKAIR